MKKKRALTDRTDSIEKDVLDSLEQEIQEAIDFDIQCDILKLCGWIRVDTTIYSGPMWADVVDWISENCQGAYKNNVGTWLFEDAKDATMFILRWS